VRAVVVGTTGVNMRALAASLDSFHKEQAAEGRGSTLWKMS